MISVVIRSGKPVPTGAKLLKLKRLPRLGSMSIYLCFMITGMVCCKATRLASGGIGR